MTLPHRLKALVAVATLLFGASLTHAAPVLQRLQITASDFVFLFGSTSPPPVSPVLIDFTVSFDNAVNILGTTSGLTINSFNLTAPLEYAYNATSDTLTLGSEAGPGNCSADVDEFCMFVQHISSSSPDAFYALQVTSGSGSWIANSFSTVVVAGTVPEPGALALVGLALMGLAAARRRA